MLFSRSFIIGRNRRAAEFLGKYYGGDIDKLPLEHIFEHMFNSLEIFVKIYKIKQNIMDKEEYGKILKTGILFAIFHDAGKSHPVFQRMLIESSGIGMERILKTGYFKNVNYNYFWKKEWRHEILSAILLSFIMRNNPEYFGELLNGISKLYGSLSEFDIETDYTDIDSSLPEDLIITVILHHKAGILPILDINSDHYRLYLNRDLLPFKGNTLEKIIIVRFIRPFLEALPEYFGEIRTFFKYIYFLKTGKLISGEAEEKYYPKKTEREILRKIKDIDYNSRRFIEKFELPISILTYIKKE